MSSVLSDQSLQNQLSEYPAFGLGGADGRCLWRFDSITELGEDPPRSEHDEEEGNERRPFEEGEPFEGRWK